MPLGAWGWMHFYFLIFFSSARVNSLGSQEGKPVASSPGGAHFADDFWEGQREVRSCHLSTWNSKPCHYPNIMQLVLRQSLQIHKVDSHFQLFATLWAIVCQPPLSMEFSRQQYCSGWPCPSLEGLPNLWSETGSLALQGRFFTIWATRVAHTQTSHALGKGTRTVIWQKPGPDLQASHIIYP